MPYYTPQAIEPKWQQFWEAHKTFRCPDPGDPSVQGKPKIRRPKSGRRQEGNCRAIRGEEQGRARHCLCDIKMRTLFTSSP